MSINKNYIVATAMMASVALPLMNVSHVDAATDIRTVTASSLNFRSGPSTSYSIIGSLKKGQQVEYISASGSWAKVKHNGVTGYVHSDYLSKGTSTGNTTSQGTTQYVNASAGLNVRSGAGTSYLTIGKLAYKEKVTVLSTSNGWAKINYNGKTGYVSTSYLQSTVPGGSSSGSSSSDSSSSDTTVSNKASAVIAYAKTLLGKPYVWGAQGPNSFDCSGFTYYVFKNKAGVVLPRTSSVQSNYGTYVSKSNLRAGDLVFFDTNGANNGAVSHVGIYIGNGQMIHASYSQKKIVIDNFN
ncbi:C40 family peptidase, partial [Intestinibacter sp.]